jgi:hypothetical protein
MWIELVTQGRFWVWALRIFLTILLNHGLRMDLVQLAETQIFLSRLADIGDPEVMRLLSTITKRLFISEYVLLRFQGSKFLARLSQKVGELADDDSVQAAVVCLDAFVGVGYVADYVAIVPEFKTVLGRQDKTAAFIIQVIAKNGFPKYFDGLESIQPYQQQCSVFEKNFKTDSRSSLSQWL